MRMNSRICWFLHEEGHGASNGTTSRDSVFVRACIIDLRKDSCVWAVVDFLIAAWQMLKILDLNTHW